MSKHAEENSVTYDDGIAHRTGNLPFTILTESSQALLYYAYHTAERAALLKQSPIRKKMMKASNSTSTDDSSPQNRIVTENVGGYRKAKTAATTPEDLRKQHDQRLFKQAQKAARQEWERLQTQKGRQPLPMITDLFTIKEEEQRSSVYALHMSIFSQQQRAAFHILSQAQTSYAYKQAGGMGGMRSIGGSGTGHGSAQGTGQGT